MRTVLSVTFTIFSAFIGWLFVRAIFTTFAGFVFAISALISAAFIYLIFFDFLCRIVEPSKSSTHSASTKSKEYVFGISLVLSATLLLIIDLLIKNNHQELTEIVAEKNNLTGMRGALYCQELILENGVSQCVNSQCWQESKVGNQVVIAPKTGLFGLNKLDIPC